ncbi:MAG: PAS domain-containing protein [Desulfomonilia bacterium]|nr:PAS domain-containing protein [Desulfomonilia bacterium]
MKITEDTLHILLVDGSRNDRSEFHQAMKHAHIPCTIVDCDSVQTARAILTENEKRFHCIISELDFQTMSGVDLFRSIREIPDHPPFVILTRNASQHAAVQAMKEGVDDCILKDDSGAYLDTLPEAMSDVLHRHRERISKEACEKLLKDTRAHLEDEVEKRTTQLIRANTRLKAEIRKRIALEKELKDQGELYSRFLDHFPGSIYIKDAQGRIVYVNRYVFDTYGWKPEECIGKTDHDLWPPDIAEGIHATDRMVLETKKELREIDQVSINGNPLSYLTQKFPIHRKNQEPMVAGMSLDITQTRQLEEDKSMLFSAVEYAVENIFILDRHGRITYLNPAAELSLGIPREKLAGTVYTHFPGIDESTSQADRGEHCALPVQKTITRKSKNREPQILKIIISPSYDEGGTIKHYTVIELDITEEEKLRNTLEQNQRMELLGILASGISHDLNNILQPILINAELLSDHIEGIAEAWEYLEEIIEAAKTGKRLVKHIKFFVSKEKPSLRPIFLHTAVRDALKMIKRNLPEGITYHQWIGARDARVEADATEVQQLVMNLCLNAIQSMSASGGTLHVSLTEVRIHEQTPSLFSTIMPGEYLKLSVRDTGSGISPGASTNLRLWRPAAPPRRPS